MTPALPVTNYTLGALMYLVAWCVSPPLAYGNAFRLLALVALGMLIVPQFRLNEKSLQKNYLAIVTFIGYVVLAMLLTRDSYIYRIGTIILVSLMICSFQVEYSTASKKFQVLLIFALVLCTLWNLTSLRGLAANPGIMRVLAKNSENSAMYARQGIGGYGYVYTVLLMLPLAWEICLRRESDAVLLWCARIFLVTTYLLIMKSAYFLAEILSVTIIPLYFVLQMKNAQHRVAVFFLVVILAGVLIAFADSILLTLHDLVGISSIKAKIWDTYQLLNGTETIEDSEFATRHQRYGSSLVYALTHPIFGGLRYAVTGNHSHILDIGAQYGLLVLWGYVHMMYQPLKRMMSSGSTAVTLVAVVLLVVVMLNSAPFALGAVLFIVMPAYVRIFQQQKLMNG